MDLNELTAISPVDGRYRRTARALAPFFSEQGLIRYRVRVEVEYLILLCKTGIQPLKPVAETTAARLRNLYLQFDEAAAREIKEVEKVTNHDVKAVEYWIKEHLPEELKNLSEFVHFGLTSQDINNTAMPLALKEAHAQVILPAINGVCVELKKLARDWKSVSMLARTHGQPASPTRLGKEIYVFVERLESQLKLLAQVPWSAKFGGATGNFNAHAVAYAQVDWISFGNEFLTSVLGLSRSQFTTQIEHYDNLAAYCDGLKRINTILLDLCRDMWTYISLEYFKQRLKQGEVGSSAMPHKVNPIDFENAEGNLGIANAVLEHLAAKLPVSRLQRDLTDSTVMRNLGVPLAHSLIACSSIMKGLGKLILNESAVNADLDANWAVVAEAIQTVLRREGYPRPYETLKDLTRVNGTVNRETLHRFIESLKVSDTVKSELKAINPHNYTGINSDY